MPSLVSAFVLFRAQMQDQDTRIRFRATLQNPVDKISDESPRRLNTLSHIKDCKQSYNTNKYNTNCNKIMMNIQTNALTLFLLFSTATATATASRRCGGDFTVWSDVGHDADDVRHVFDEFKGLLGGENNQNLPSQKDGFRQVNWDADVVPFDMPGDFFATVVDRGLVVESKSEVFRVSNPPDGENGSGDDLFDSINANAAKDFQTFSPKRLFSTLKENELEVEWTVPGTNGRKDATVEGFGVIFVDVKLEDTTKMVFYAKSGCIITEQYVPAKSNGLSFLGVISEDDRYPIFETEIVVRYHWRSHLLSDLRKIVSNIHLQILVTTGWNQRLGWPWKVRVRLRQRLRLPGWPHVCR